MPKRVFWPLALVVMGLIFMASSVGLLPREFWNLWPIILVVVGLGGLVTSDREEWDATKSSKRKSAKKSGRKSSKKTKKSSRKKK